MKELNAHGMRICLILAPVSLLSMLVSTSAQKADRRVDLGPADGGERSARPASNDAGGSFDPLSGIGRVVRERKISAVFGGFSGHLDDDDRFGSALATLGDLDGDGVVELAVGAPRDDDGGSNRGGVWLLFLSPDGSVKREEKLTSTSGAAFGTALAPLGDFDGDGVVDLAVGRGPFFFTVPGSVDLLFLNVDGTVRDSRVITGDFPNSFGEAVDVLGDLDGDGITDLVVGAPRAPPRGAAVILFMNADGTVRDSVVYAKDTVADLEFGSSVVGLGDLDGDGVVDMAVGTPAYHFVHGQPGSDAGGFFVYRLEPDGTPKEERFVTRDCFPWVMGEGEAQFGNALVLLSDLDADGVRDLGVGAWRNQPPGPGCDTLDPPQCKRGAFWIVFGVEELPRPCNEIPAVRITEEENGFQGPLDQGDQFGGALAPLGDLDGDGFLEIAVGAPFDDDGGSNQGAVWILSIDGYQTVDFETKSGSTVLVANGREISGSTELGGLAEIEGVSASGLPAVVFDSTPDGPNAASSDPDLLVDRGNVLILQEVPGESVPGVFDFPDDDSGGGGLSITFGGKKVELQSIDLIDICPQPGQDAIVTLIDVEGSARVYTVPSGWTGDVAMDGPPGFRRLDLTSLLEQPGFQTAATVFESVGFDSKSVVRLDLELLGSGAADNLVYRAQASSPRAQKNDRDVLGP